MPDKDISYNSFANCVSAQLKCCTVSLSSVARVKCPRRNDSTSDTDDNSPLADMPLSSAIIHITS